MIVDATMELTTTVAFDLGAVRPGPGEPIKIMAVGVSGTVTITHCATIGGSYTANSVQTCGAGIAEFVLQSDTLQFIKVAFAAGSVEVVLPGVQTNK